MRCEAPSVELLGSSTFPDFFFPRCSAVVVASWSFAPLSCSSLHATAMLRATLLAGRGRHEAALWSLRSPSFLSFASR